MSNMVLLFNKSNKNPTVFAIDTFHLKQNLLGSSSEVWLMKVSLEHLKKANIRGFNSNTLTYDGDECSINKAIGAVGFKSKEHNYTAVFSLTKDGKPVLRIVPYLDIENTPEYSKLTNRTGVLDFDDVGDKIFNIKLAGNKLNTTIGTDFTGSSGRRLSRQIIDTMFWDKQYTYAYLAENNMLEIHSENPDIEIVEKPVESVESVEKEGNLDKNGDNMEKDLDNSDKNNPETSSLTCHPEPNLVDLQNNKELLDAVISELSTLKASLQKKNSMMDDILTGLESDNTPILEVESALTLNESAQVKRSVSDNVYELILKSILANDTVSIPRDYLANIPVKIIKMLESNLNGDRYKAIVAIRFDRNSENAILAIKDNDDSAEYNRITVLQPYSNSVITNDIANKYYRIYQENRRKQMIFNS